MRIRSLPDRRRLDLPDTRVVRESAHRPGQLPSFARPLGLDVIVTEAGDPWLVEVQHGFGRRGLIELFPRESALYRRTLARLLRQHGRSTPLVQGMARLGSNKLHTYQLLARYQPASFHFRGWTPALEAWLDGLAADLLLAKPPRGSCGEGILVLGRRAFRHAAGSFPLGGAVLLQEFVRSRLLPGPDGGRHLGCIRQVVILASDGARLDLLHLPAYWRVSPRPCPPWATRSKGTAPAAITAAREAILAGDREALTANISRGAFPLPVSAADAERVRELARLVCTELVGHILGLPEVPPGESRCLAPGDGAGAACG